MKVAYILFLLLVTLCSGCGTFVSHMYGPPPQGAYYGIRTDAQAAGRGSPLFLVDLPFSFAADTLFLPVDLWPPATPQEPFKDWTFREFDEFAVPRNQHHYHLDPAITMDYKDFITKRKLFLSGAITGFFEDGKGQRAVSFEAFDDGDSSWQYALIYDPNNKRIKVMKYNHHRYMS